MIHQATMQLERAFRAENFKFELDQVNDSSELEAKFDGDNVKNISVRFISHDEDNDVSIRAYSIVNVNPSKKANAILAVNELNNKYRYLKFTLDSDNDINAEYDLPVRCDNPGPVCAEMFVHFMKIIDKAYPTIMQALWS